MVKGYDKDVEVLWQDRKRIFGLPISFTKFMILRKPGKWTKVIRQRGIFHTEIEEVHIYRIDDLGLYKSFINGLFGVANVDIYCNDASCGVLRLENIPNALKVKNMLNELVEDERKKKNFHNSEIATIY